MLLLALIACTDPCPDDRCEVPLGEYYVAAPERAPDAAVLYLHGANGSAEEATTKESITGDLLAAGVLVVAPQGEGGVWGVSAWNSSLRDEFAFHDEILADLRARYGVEDIYSSGFSLGASIVWELACERPQDYAGFYAMSGQLWEPLPASCEGESVPFVQRHGTEDETFPIEGRDFGGARQSDLYEAWALWVERGECAPLPDEGACAAWDCDGVEIARCIEGHGHRRPEGWGADLVERFGL